MLNHHQLRMKPPHLPTHPRDRPEPATRSNPAHDEGVGIGSINADTAMRRVLWPPQKKASLARSTVTGLRMLAPPVALWRLIR